MKRLLFSLLISGVLGAGAAYAETTTPIINIRLDHGAVWKTNGRETTTEGFLQIHNDGTTDDTLTSWSCPNATSTKLMAANGKVLEQLVIPAGHVVTLAPGGMYLALSGLQYPVERGSIMPCAFEFAQAGQIGGFLNEVKPPKK